MRTRINLGRFFLYHPPNQENHNRADKQGNDDNGDRHLIAVILNNIGTEANGSKDKAELTHLRKLDRLHLQLLDLPS